MSKDAKGHGSDARGVAGAAHQATVNQVGKWRLNSHTHEIVSPAGEVAARMRLGKNNGLAVDTRESGQGISSSGGTALHDAVMMADYRARNHPSFPAEHIGGEMHYLTGKDFAGHTVRRVK